MIADATLYRIIGQSASSCIGFTWTYNADPTLATGEIFTPGNQPLRIQGTSTGPLLVGSGAQIGSAKLSVTGTMASTGVSMVLGSFTVTADRTGTLLMTTVAGKYRVKTDGTFQLWNADQSLWHALTVSGAAGAELLNIAAGES